VTAGRTLARAKIVRAANRGSYRAARGRPFTMRTIGEAVCRVRRFGLVSDKVLIAAGFRPRRKPGRHPKAAS